MPSFHFRWQKLKIPVTDGKETNPDYKVGTIQLLGVSSFASVVCIAEVEGQLLVCLPNSVWGKRKTDRSLPGNSFKKSISGLCSSEL